MSYLRLTPGDIEIGRPVPWPLYDEQKKLLLARGVVVESESQKRGLLERGLYRRLVPASRPQEEAAAAAPERPAGNLCTLEDVKLDIGDTLQLQADGGQARHYVKLIGYLKGKSVLITTPTQDGKVLLMREGQNFVVRLFSGKSVFAFASAIHKVANVPFPHLHLTYPAQVRGLVVRRGARARVALAATVAGADGRPHPATITDLSTGGAMLVARAAFGLKDERISIRFRVAVGEAEQELVLPAVLRSIRTLPGGDADGGQVSHGVQFDALPHAEQVVLSAYVYRILFEESAEA